MLSNVLLKSEKPSGGAAVQGYAWMCGLLDSGQQVMAMTNIKKGLELKSEAKRILLLPLYNPQKGVRWIRWVYYRIPYIYKTLKKHKPDYLIQSIPHWSSFLLSLICASLKIKLIIRVSCDHLIEDRFYQFYGRTHKVLMNLGFFYSYAIICQNDYQYYILKKKFKKKKISKFGNPFINNAVEDLLPYKERIYIAWVGLFQSQKNMRLLFEIATLLKNEQFKIAGKANFVDIDAETKHYIKQIKKLQNVEFVGYLNRSQLILYLKKAKFLLNTSHYEGFSNTFLESMFCGTPILTTKNANPDDIIANYNLGFIYQNPEHLKEIIENIDENNFNNISDNSIQYVKTYHDYQSLAMKLIIFLRK